MFPYVVLAKNYNIPFFKNSHFWLFYGVFEVTIGNPRVTMGHPRVTIGHPRVTKGHPRVTIGSLLVITFLSLSKHKANTTELLPKIRQACFLCYCWAEILIRRITKNVDLCYHLSYVRPPPKKKSTFLAIFTLFHITNW